MFISLDLSLLFDDENISDHRVVSVCVFLFPLSQLMFDLEINKPLVSSFAQDISSLQSCEFSFSVLCLYTIKITKYRSRVFLTSGLKEE